MIKKEVIIENEFGLHIRPAAILAKEANKCKSKVLIQKGSLTINCKSVLNIISGHIKYKDKVEIICIGKTEKDDIEKIVFQIKNKLGE